MQALRRSVEEFEEKDLIMTKEKFEGFHEENEPAKFDYGSRDVLKNKQFEDSLVPPFRNFPLLSH